MKASSNISAAPTVMAESATLKAGNCASFQCARMKSTTCPLSQPVDQVAQRAGQDQRQAQGQQLLRRPSSLRSQYSSPMPTATARPENSHRCQPEALSSMLQAAPRLYLRVISSTGSSVRMPPYGIWLTIQALES